MDCAPFAADRGPDTATVMKDLPLSKVYQLLEPGPVVLLTTASKGRANVMTMSWHMMVEFEPPLVACVVSSADYRSEEHTSELQSLRHLVCRLLLEKKKKKYPDQSAGCASGLHARTYPQFCAT